MGNFRPGYLQTGAPLGMVRKQVTLVADDTGVDVSGVSMLYISSDNTTAANRTFTITSSTLVGHELTLVFESGASTTCQLADSGNVKLSAVWTPTQYDALKVFWDGAYWVEISRTAASGTLDIPLTDAHILVGNSSGLAADVAVSGDITLANTGEVAIASGAIVNADVNGSAAIAFSKLAALPSAQILVGNGSNVAAAVAVTGDVTISNAGVTAIATDVIVNADVKSDAAIAFSKLAALPSAEILVGNGSNVATAVAVTGDVTISNAGVTAIAAGAVALADLASPISPSHVVKYAGQHTTVGGAADEAITVTGLAATDLVFCQVKDDGTSNVTILQAVPTSNTLTVTFSANPGNDTVIYYQALRATS